MVDSQLRRRGASERDTTLRRLGAFGRGDRFVQRSAQHLATRILEISHCTVSRINQELLLIAIFIASLFKLSHKLGWGG